MWLSERNVHYCRRQRHFLTVLAEVLSTSNTESFHPGDKGANQVNTSLQAALGTYLAEVCPCSEAHQTPEWLLQTKISSAPQPGTLWTVPRSHHQGGVLRDDPSSGESQGHREAFPADPKRRALLTPAKPFVSCNCGCNCEWTFKEGDEARLFGKSFRHFFCMENRAD